jgi:hypothetical protein
MAAFSEIELRISFPCGASNRFAVSVYFYHTSRVIKGGSITTTSNRISSGISISRGALKS